MVLHHMVHGKTLLVNIFNEEIFLMTMEKSTMRKAYFHNISFRFRIQQLSLITTVLEVLLFEGGT